MSTADAVAAVLWIAATFYAVFGGADFGAGLWDLFAPHDRSGEHVRSTIRRAIGPVWEANHVWLIFSLVVLWTAFPPAFEAIMSTLFLPLSLAAIGIVLRGSGFALRGAVASARARTVSELLFALSSLLTPFFMGAAVGAIASGRVPPGNAQGDPISSWANATGLVTGALFVATCAYLAAVFLVRDCERFGEAETARYFRRRALLAAALAGGLAIAAMFVYRSDAHFIYEGLTGDALPLVIASVLAGIAAVAAMLSERTQATRALAVAAVVAVVWGWAVAQHPYLLPQDLTIGEAAGAPQTLDEVLVVFAVAVVVVLPSLGLLFLLDQRSLVHEQEDAETR